VDKNMKNPKITVLMPVYNAEKFLKEAIDSILNQTFKDFEFLIINDASTDNSKKIIMSYDDKRIRYFENNCNLGIPKTLNKGLKIAKGKYIARMDADDISLSNRLKLQFERLEKDRNLIIISSRFDWINENNNFISTYKRTSLSEEIFYELQFHNCLGHPTIIFNKNIIVNEFRGYDERYEVAQDYDLWLRVSKIYKIVSVDSVLMKIRRSKKSKTSLFRKSSDRNAINITQKNLQTIIGEHIDVGIVGILANINPLSHSSQKIKVALAILKKVNINILEQCPSFLDKSILKNCCEHKARWISYCLLTVILFKSWLGPIFNCVYKLYRLIKYS
jgi:glycosyltransferase involved in cell wall biosynthesis